MNTRIRRLDVTIAGILLFFLVLELKAADTDFYAVVKGRNFKQVDAGVAQLDTNDPPFRFNTFIDMSAAGSVSSAVLTVPNGSMLTMTNESESNKELKIQGRFASAEMLDAAVGAGDFTLHVVGTTDGPLSATLTLASNSYPAAPHVLNWAAAQGMVASNDFVLTWEPMVNGTTNDFLQVQVDSQNGSVYESGPPLSLGALDGTATQTTIPAGTLQPGHVYRAQILFVRIADVESSGIPGATGLAGYYAETDFEISAVNPAGTLRYATPKFYVRESNATAVVTVVRTGGSVGTVSVAFGVFSSWAEAGLDFVATNGVLTFEDGVTNQSFTVQILQDELQESVESALLFLDEPTGGAGLLPESFGELLILDDDSVWGTDAVFYFVAKGQRFLQFGTNPPAPDTERPYNFSAGVKPRSEETIMRGSVLPPGGTVLNFSGDGGEFNYEQIFSTSNALEAAYGSGDYLLTIVGINDATQHVTLSLTNSSYPTVPRILNPVEALTVDASVGFTLLWAPFVGGTANDFIKVSVGGNERSGYESPEPFQEGALNGTATSLTVPARSLMPGQEYSIEILFVRVSDSDTESYAGVPGIAGRYRETRAVLSTVNPAGTLRFASAQFSATEGESAMLSVERTGGSAGTVTVDYSTIPGSADNEVDFAPTFGTLTFPEGVTNQTIVIGTVQDTDVEGPENFSVSLANVTGEASLGALNSAAVWIEDDETPPGPDVTFYLVGKSQGFVQTNASQPRIEPERAFEFLSFADVRYPGSVTAAHLQAPLGLSRLLTNHDQSFKYGQTFASSNALETAFPVGTYTFSIQALNDGLQTPSLQMPAIQYPALPHIANWDAAQAVDASANFELQWDPLSGASSSDFIRVSLEGENGGAFETAEFGSAEAYNGLSNSVVIPANHLLPDHTYDASILIARPVVVNTNSYPGVTGVVVFIREVHFSLVTGSTAPSQGRLQFATVMSSINETGGVATLQVLRNGGSAGIVTVDIATSNLSATDGEDYTGWTNTLTFADGEAEQSVLIDILDDTLVESREAFGVTLSNPTGGAILGVLSNATVFIQDNESTNGGVFNLSVTNFAAAENVGALEVTVIRSGGVSDASTVLFGTSDETATAGSDYQGTTTLLSFAAGETRKSVRLMIVNDDLDEGLETFTIALTEPSRGAALGARVNARVTINDNDTAGLIQFVSGEYTVDESADSATITLKRTGGSAGGVSVHYAATGVSATEGSDFVSAAGVVTFASNEMTQTFSIEIIPDLEPEGDELINLALSDPQGGAVLGTLIEATLIILDNEVSINFSTVSYTNREGGPAVLLAVMRTGPATSPVSFQLTTLDGSATGDADYTSVDTNLTLAAGQRIKTFSIPIENDGLAEADETFGVLLSDPVGADLGTHTEAAVTIVDDDLGGVISFALTNFSVSEVGPMANVTVMRAGGKAEGVTVHFDTQDLDAQDGLDYEGVSTNLTFAANEVRKTVQIAILNDSIQEAAEMFTVLLSEPGGGATLGERTQATVRILDNDKAGILELLTTTYSISETGGVVSITVKRSGGNAGGVTVEYQTIGLTATPDADFVNELGSLVFNANELTKSFDVAIVNDDLPEGDETFKVILQGATGGATVGAKSNAVVTIRDDEMSVQFARSLFTNSEAGPAALITLSRAGPLTEAVTVHFATTVDTATPDVDYREVNTNVTIAAGVATKTISVPILNDTLVEGDETVGLQLSEPVGAQLGNRSTASLTIVDNDLGGVIQFAVTNMNAAEGRTVKITITRTGGAASGVTVGLASADGTAVAGTDFTAVESTLTFEAREVRKTFLVPITADTQTEGAEQFTLILSNPTGGATLGPRSTVTFNIGPNSL